jgi:hypothetical protein
MPRQLSDPYANLVLPDRVIAIEEGGTAASTSQEAINNIGGISRHVLGRPNGVAISNSAGKFTIPSNSIAISEAVEGPRQLVRGSTATYRITNFDSRRPVTVSASAGSVVQNGEEFQITAPGTGSQIVLTIGNRSVIVPLVSGGLIKPLILHPENGHKQEMEFVTFVTDSFQYSAEVQGAWNEVAITNGNIAFPAGAHAIECYGGNGAEGKVTVTVDGKIYTFPVTEVRRKIVKGVGADFTVSRTGTATLRWRALSSGARHVSTDWQIATDDQFANVVESSMADTTNLTSWTVELEAGTYYVRSRFNGQTT